MEAWEVQLRDRASETQQDCMQRNWPEILHRDLLSTVIILLSLAAAHAAIAQQFPAASDPLLSPPVASPGPAVPTQTTTLTPPVTPIKDTAAAGAGVGGHAQALEECEVIAKVDGQVVQACEVLWQVNTILQDNMDKIPPEQVAEVRKMLMLQRIGGLVDTKLLYADFLRTIPQDKLGSIDEKLKVPFEEKQLPRLLERFGASNVEDLERKLMTLGTSIDDMRQAFQEQAIAGEWLRSNIEYDEEVTHDEMLEYYRDNRAEYEYPTQARWEELMVRFNRFKSRQVAMKAICEMGNTAYQNAVAGGAKGPVFAEIAKVRSHGYTAKEGGVHDWTTKGALKDSALDRALFELPVGQMSHPIESTKGFHIVRVLERKQAGRTPFQDVQADIVNEIQEGRYREAVEKYLTELRRNGRIWTVYTGDTTVEMLANPLAQPGGPARR